MPRILSQQASLLHICCALLYGLMIPAQVSAHHSHSNLNKKDIQQHRGIVTKLNWRMPHVYMKVSAPNAQGAQVEYSIELLHPPAMLERGWQKNTFQVGDSIIWLGAMDKNPNRYYSGLTWAENSVGERFDLKLKKTPIEPSTDYTGIWVSDLKGKRPFYAPPEGWPLTKKGMDLVAGFEQTQNPQVKCQNPGIPKATLLPYPIKVSRPDADKIVLEYELREGQREIHLTVDHQPGPPSKWGHSVGHMQGEVLVVRTDNFIADRWGNHTGIDSSEQKTLVERFSLTDGGFGVEIRMTLTDPVYLTEPFEIVHHWRKIGDRELVDSTCSLESARGFIDS